DSGEIEPSTFNPFADLKSMMDKDK
ncbi:hypothetical protein MNBD_GAMMA12-2081, partial [hydrothermal vent metagenome]